jgi:hypothetical protein
MAFQRHGKELAEARRLVLDEYNLFPTMAKLCSERDGNAPKESLELRPIGELESVARRMARVITRRLPAGARRLLK